MSSSLWLRISSPVKTDKVLTEKYFQCVGNCLFWLIAFIRERQIFFMHFKLYSFMHFIHFYSSGKEVIFYPSPAENIVVLTAKNRRNIFHFQTVFLISFHILLWQWKLEKDKSKINNNFFLKARNSNSWFLLMLLGKRLTTEAPMWLFCASKWAWEQRMTQNFSHFCSRD